MPPHVPNRMPASYAQILLVLFLLAGAQVVFGQDTIRYTGSQPFCEGTILTTTPTGSTYQWSLDGVNTVTTPSYAVTKSGVVSVVVNGRKYNDLTIIVNPKPLVGFISNNDNTCSGTPIQFTSSITNGTQPYIYAWLFGDGGTSNLQNPLDTLYAVGCSGTTTFSNKLTVTDANGCLNSVINPIRVLQKPDVQLADSNVFAPFKNCDNHPTAANPNYRLKVSNISPSAACISGYSIDWGDGNTQTGLNAGSFPIVHTYTQLGFFNLVFTGIGNNGCNNSITYVISNQSNPAGSLGSLGATTGLCAPATIPFTITNWQNNSPGTTYVLDYDDGTIITLPHPLNLNYTTDTVNHTYITSSCPGSSTFVAKLNVTNGCGVTPYTAGNIQINISPKANFTLPNSGCVGTSTCFTNTTLTGYNGAGCSALTVYNWDFGDPSSGAGNSSSAFTGCHTYSATGTYNVTLSANNPCGTTTVTKQVCIVAPPIPSFTLNNSTGCIPLTVTATNTSNTLTNCAVPTYTWNVTYTAANCGTATNPINTYANGTNKNSVNPAFVFSNSGNYSISLSITNPCGTVTSAIQTVSVKKPPTVSITNLLTACSPATIKPTATIGNCGTTAPTYVWTFTGGTPASSTLANPDSVTYSTPGTYPITLAVTNECGTTTTTVNMIVTTPPVANAGPDKNTCSGVPIQIGATASGGFTYGWLPATGLNNASAANPTATLNYTGANPDTVFQYIIKTSAGATCFSYDTVLITVKAKPFVNITPTNTQICAGNSTTLTASGADTYLWSPATGLSAINLAVVTATPTNNIIYTVTGTNTATGCTNTAQIALIVVAIANVNAGPDTVVCRNTAAVQLIGTPSGGVWAGPSVSPTGIFNPQTAGNGVYTLYYTAGATGCSRTDSMVATVIDAALASAGNDTTVCASPTTFTLRGQPSGGTWSGSSFVTAAGVFNPSTAGTYQLYYSIGSGSCIGRDTMIVNVGSGVANNTISPNQNICTGVQPAMIIGQNASGGNGAATYQWQSSTDSTTWTNIAGATGVSYTPPIILTTTFYRRIANTTLCAGAQGSTSVPVKIKINPDAKALFAPTVTNGCVPFKITAAIINLTPFPANNGQYNWYVNGVPIGSGQTFPGYVMSNPGDSITIKLVAVSLFGCKSDSMQVGFKTVVRPVPAFTQSDSVGCGPLRITFTNLTPTAANYTYLWDFGTGQTSTLAQPGAINFPKNPNYGDTVYTVKFKTLSQCDTITLTSFVRVRSTPKALFTPDKSVGCSPMTVTFSNTTRGAVTQPFVWNFGDGSPQLTSNAATVQHTYNVGQRDTFRVKLVAVNDCGSDTLVYALVVQPNTIRLDFAINGNNRYGCAPQNVAFINNTSGANAFTWNFGDGSSLLNTTRGVDTIYHTYNTVGNFTATLKASNSCSDTSDVELVTVFAKPKVAVSAFPLTVCIGDTVRFINQSDTGVSNLWRFGDGTASFNRAPIKTYASPGSFGVNYTASYIYTNGTVCADSGLLNIMIRDTLSGTFSISDTVSACAPFAITLKYKGGNSLQTKWDFGDGTNGLGDSLVHTFTTPGAYVVRMYVKENTGGCISTASQKVVIGGVTGSFTYQSGYACINNPVSFKAVSINAGQYRYFFGDGDSLTTSVTPVLHNYTKPGYYFPSVQLISGACIISIKGTDTVKVDAAKPGFIAKAATNCGTTAIQFTDTSYSYFGIKQYVWDFGDGTATSSLQNPLHTYTTGGNYTIALKTTGISGCINTASIPLAVMVHNYPVASINSDSTICTNQPLALVANVQSIDNIQSLDWNFGNNATGSGVNVKASYALAGNYSVRLIARTVLGCADTAYQTVRVNTSPIVVAGADVTICKGQFLQIGAIGASSFTWYPAAGLSCTTCASPIASPTFTTNYVVVGKNGAGCIAADSIIVNVVQPLKITVSADDSICIGDRTQLTASNASSYTWNPSTGLSNGQIANPIAMPTYTTRYRVVGTDASNCFTDTGFVVVAVGQYPVVDFGTNGGLVIAGTPIQFNPTITNGPIRYYRWTPTRNLSCTSCSNPIATINTDVTYILQVENIYGCAGSDTVSYKVNCDPSQVFIPTGFSPDGDGINDVLMVRAKGVAQVKYFRIFDRWGRLVFERNNISANDPLQGWDGKEGGKYANPDVYVYTAEVVCTAGGTFVYKGNVTLVR